LIFKSRQSFPPRMQTSPATGFFFCPQIGYTLRVHISQRDAPTPQPYRDPKNNSRRHPWRCAPRSRHDQSTPLTPPLRLQVAVLNATVYGRSRRPSELAAPRTFFKALPQVLAALHPIHSHASRPSGQPPTINSYSPKRRSPCRDPISQIKTSSKQYHFIFVLRLRKSHTSYS
jgi:hypothetical protein